MAVSSSVGSNIFDVTVGWVVYTVSIHYFFFILMNHWHTCIFTTYVTIICKVLMINEWKQPLPDITKHWNALSWNCFHIRIKKTGNLYKKIAIMEMSMIHWKSHMHFIIISNNKYRINVLCVCVSGWFVAVCPYRGFYMA